MNRYRSTQVLLLCCCCVSLFVLGVSAEEQYYGDYGWGLFTDATVSIEEMIPQQAITGHVRLSSPYELQYCQLAIYEWATNGWRRYAGPRSGSTPLQVIIQDDGWAGSQDWSISLKHQPPLPLPFAVLAVESSKMDALPEFIETLAKIDHLGHAIRAEVFQGDIRQPSRSLTNQENVDQIFETYELFISTFLRELHERPQVSSSGEQVLVLIIGAVNYPDIYEVNRKFEFSSILETAKGYKIQKTPHKKEKTAPSSVKIIRHIEREAQLFVIPYQKWKRNPEQYEFFLEDGDILDFPGSF